MIYKTEGDFAKDWKAGVDYPLYLLYGSEDYLIGLYLQKIRKRYLSVGQENFNYNQLEGKEYQPNLLSQTLEAMPLLNDKRLVQLEDPDPTRLAEDPQFAEMIGDIPPYTVLVIVLRQTALTPTKQKSHKKFLELCAAQGATVELGVRSEQDLIKFCQATLQKYEITLPRGEAEELLQICNREMNKLVAELAKLVAYLPRGGQVTKELLQRLVIPTLDARIYDLSKAVVAGNQAKAMEIVDQLFAMQQPPLVILSALSQHYIQLYKAFLAKKNNISMGEAASVFGYKPDDFRIKNAFRDCTKYSQAYLHRVITILTQTDYQLKSSRLEDRILIERTVVEIFMAKGMDEKR